MKTLKFDVNVQAPLAVVWRTMLDQDTYRLWTASFCEGSYYEGSWEEGAEIYFLDPKKSGMFAKIAENKFHEFISIKILGCMQNGIKDTESVEAISFVGGYENYHFTALGNSTRLNIETGTTPEFENYMIAVWPKALDTLKLLCEKTSKMHHE
jgi:hypothetical protein